MVGVCHSARRCQAQIADMSPCRWGDHNLKGGMGVSTKATVLVRSGTEGGGECARKARPKIVGGRVGDRLQLFGLVAVAAMELALRGNQVLVRVPR